MGVEENHQGGALGGTPGQVRFEVVVQARPDDDRQAAGLLAVGHRQGVVRGRQELIPNNRRHGPTGRGFRLLSVRTGYSGDS